MHRSHDLMQVHSSNWLKQSMKTRLPTMLKSRRFWIVSFLMVVLVILLAQEVTLAQTSIRLETRLNNLEYEVDRLRSQIRQVNAQRPGVAVPDRPAPRLDSGRPAPPVTDNQFDNLATLAIENKQDIQALQARLAELEAR